MTFSRLWEIISCVLMLTLFVCWMIVIIKFLCRGKSPVKTVDAVVVEKYKHKHVSKYQSTFSNESCVVVFSVNGKKKSFTVSEFTYDGYKIKEKGKLKYKGDKIIDFS